MRIFELLLARLSGGSSSDEATVSQLNRNSLTSLDLTKEKKIRDYLCYGNDITEVSFGSGLKEIGVYAFAWSDLTSVVIPDKVTTIGDNAFRNCIRMTSLTIGNGVTSIGSNAFEDCNRLTSIVIPNSVTSIGNYAFRDCIGLTSVTFEGTPSIIYANAFTGCTNITDIYVPWAENEVANAPWGATNATIHYES